MHEGEMWEYGTHAELLASTAITTQDRGNAVNEIIRSLNV